jgi:hypothetical protein
VIYCEKIKTTLNQDAPVATKGMLLLRELRKNWNGAISTSGKDFYGIERESQLTGISSLKSLSIMFWLLY